jgi:hypothetical protein
MPTAGARGAAASPAPHPPRTHTRTRTRLPDVLASPAQLELAGAARAASAAAAFKAGGGSALTPPAQQPYSSEWTQPYASRARPAAPQWPGAAQPGHACVFRAARSGGVPCLGQRAAAAPPPPPPPRPRLAAGDEPLSAAATAALAAAAAGAARVDVVAGKLVVGPALPLDLDRAAPPLAGHRLSAPTVDDISYVLGKWNQQGREDRVEARRLVAQGRGAGGAGGQRPGEGAERAAGALELYGAASTLICK